MAQTGLNDVDASTAVTTRVDAQACAARAASPPAPPDSSAGRMPAPRGGKRRRAARSAACSWCAPTRRAARAALDLLGRDLVDAPRAKPRDPGPDARPVGPQRRGLARPLLLDEPQQLPRSDGEQHRPLLARHRQHADSGLLEHGAQPRLGRCASCTTRPAAARAPSTPARSSSAPAGHPAGGTLRTAPDPSGGRPRKTWPEPSWLETEASCICGIARAPSWDMSGTRPSRRHGTGGANLRQQEGFRQRAREDSNL